MKVLRRAGADIDLRDALQRTAVGRAAQADQVNIGSLRYGRHIWYVTHTMCFWLCMPLCFCVQLEAMELLLEWGGRVRYQGVFAPCNHSR